MRYADFILLILSVATGAHFGKAKVQFFNT